MNKKLQMLTSVKRSVRWVGLYVTRDSSMNLVSYRLSLCHVLDNIVYLSAMVKFSRYGPKQALADPEG
jgi:hypothetical protein